PALAESDILEGSNWTLPVLFVSGSDYEMGWQQGREWRSLLHGLTERFYDQLARGGGYWLFRHVLPSRLYHLWQFVPSHLQAEMQGMAAGAELPLADILLINFFDDVLNLLELGWATACTTVAVRTSGDRVVIGRNLDYYGPVGQIARPFHVAVRRSPCDPKRHATLTVGIVGQVGALTGMNDTGLSAGTMTAMTRERTWHGLGVSLLYRDLLEHSKAVPEALAQFHRYQPVQGNSLLLADRHTAARVQFTSRRSRVTHLVHEPLATANHFLDTELAATRTALHDRAMALGSYQRHSRLCELTRTGMTEAELLSALTDVPPATSSNSGGDRWLTMSAINSRGTLHSAVLDPRNRSVCLAIGSGDRPIQPSDYVSWQPFADIALPATQIVLRDRDGLRSDRGILSSKHRSNDISKRLPG
ncbi:MAG: C45 family peptidase, partial [Cyanobacteria bacterium J06648_11]